jgi:Zn-dependent alcohol dehydrogenase
MELILVRHGRPARMETTSDPHLNEIGLEQARRAAAWLALEPIDATWSSTMLRAVQTAEAFASLVGHEVQKHPGIVEFDRNSGVYIPTEELKKENFEAWQAMATGGHGVERAVECSAHHAARAMAIRATRKWGKIALIGEGGRLEMSPSPDMIHDQKTLYGSWVTSTWRMMELVEQLVRWDLHPADLITHRFALDQAEAAYALMASGKCGKVAVCFDEELT